MYINHLKIDAEHTYEGQYNRIIDNITETESDIDNDEYNE